MRKTHKKTASKIFGLKVRRKKRKANSRKIILSIIGVLVFIALGGIGASYFSPKEGNQNIKISGIAENSPIPEENFKKTVKEAFKSYSLLGANIDTGDFFKSNKAKVNSIIEKFPQIEDIEVKKDNKTGELMLEVKEKKPSIIWCEDEKCTLLDNKGVFIKDYNLEEEYKDFPRIEKKEWGDGKDYKNKIIDSVYKINEVLKENTNFKRQTYSAFSDKLSVKGEEKCEIIFDPNEDISWQIEKIQTILKKDEYSSTLSSLEYIDLRFKNQVIIK